MNIVLNKIKQPLNFFDIIYFVFFLTLPFVYLEELIDPVVLIRLLYLNVFLLILVVAILFKRIKINTEIFKYKLPITLLSLLVLVVVSISQSLVKSESIHVLVKFISYFFFFIITSILLFKKELSVKNLSFSIMMFCFISSLIGLYQFVNIHNNIQEITSTMANKNLFSSLLFLTIPFILFNFFSNITLKISSIIILSLNFFLIIVTQSKAVYIALFLFLFFLLIFSVFRLKISTNKLRLIFGLAIIFITSITIIIVKNNTFFPHLSNLGDTFETRINIWDNSLKMFFENPFFGVGAGNWKFHFPKYGLNEFEKVIGDGLTIFQRPHNDFLWILTEFGIFGLLAFVLLLGLLFYYLFKIIRSSIEFKENFFYIAIAACLVGYLFISFVDFPLERIEHQLIFFLIISIVFAKYIKLQPKSIKEYNFHYRSILLIFPIILFSIYNTASRISTEINTKKIYSSHKKSEWTRLIKLVEANENKFYETDPMSIPLEWYKGVALFSTNNVKSAEESFSKCYKLTPYNIHVINNLASCYEAQGNHNKAIQLYNQALAITHNFDESRLNLSAAYFNSKDYKLAFETINEIDICCIDPKYRVFLYAILTERVKLLQVNLDLSSLPEDVKQIKASEKEILYTFFDAKLKNITFDQHYLKTYNQILSYEKF